MWYLQCRLSHRPGQARAPPESELRRCHLLPGLLRARPPGQRQGQQLVQQQGLRQGWLLGSQLDQMLEQRKTPGQNLKWQAALGTPAEQGTRITAAPVACSGSGRGC